LLAILWRLKLVNFDRQKMADLDRR